jgi:hypothetical protein
MHNQKTALGILPVFLRLDKIQLSGSSLLQE